MNAHRCIGKDGGLPWHISEDLKHFRAVTTGHAIIMGRRTWDSIGRPLPNRRNIVVTRNTDLEISGCDVVPDLAAAIRLAREGGDEEPRIVGGASLYEQALPLVTRMYLTRVEGEVHGCDTFFPAWNEDEWQETERREGEDPRVIFLTFDRR
jgi:dihydrofolate reductase